MFIIQINSYLANQSHIVHWNQNLCQKVSGKKFLEIKALVKMSQFSEVLGQMSLEGLFISRTFFHRTFLVPKFRTIFPKTFFQITFLAVFCNQSQIVLYFTLTYISYYTLLYFNYIFYTLYSTVQCCPAV